MYVSIIIYLFQLYFVFVSTEDGSIDYRNVCNIVFLITTSMFYPALALLFALRLLRGADCVLDVVKRNYGRDGLKLYRELSKFSRKCMKVNQFCLKFCVLQEKLN